DRCWLDASGINSEGQRSAMASAATAAGMHVLAVPAWMFFVRIQSPAQDEARAVLVLLFLAAHGIADQSGEFAVRLVAAFVGGVGVFCIRLHTWQRRPAAALGRLAGTLFQLGFCQ